MKISHRYSGAVLFEDDSATIRDCLRAAIAAEADLAEADLAEADLTGANLTGANLAGANLTWANLTWANLTRANLAGADLAGTDLAEAQIAWANLAGANLAWANLAEANLAGADLAGADLTRANLTGANLTGVQIASANTAAIREDFHSILSVVPAEVPGLLSALKDGEVDGSTYQGDCACLVGTVANLRQCAFQAIPNLAPDSSRPAERFFLAIREGDTPETNAVSHMAVQWIDEWLERAA